MMEHFEKASQELCDENLFLRLIIQNAAAPIFVIDSTHKIIFWNSALAKLTGKSSFQMVGTKQHWSAFYPTKRPVLADLVIDQTLNRVKELYSSHSSSMYIEGSLRAEGWYDNLGGKRRYIFFEATPIKNSSNEIVAAVETLEDITDRKIGEEATAAHNLFLQEVMDAIPNPVYYKDIKGSYLGCNAAFKSFFRKTAAEIIGQTLQDIMLEKYSGQSIRKDQDIIESSKSIQYETELVSGDGTIREVFASKAPLINADGSLAGIVGSFVDVTDQRKMDDQIRKMSRAIEQSPATIVITDVHGVIEYVNPKFSQTSGYSSEEAIGLNPRILKSGETSADGYEELWRTITSGKEWRGEFHNKRKDGTLYWEFASISPLLDKNGIVTSFLAVKEDITERKQTQKTLMESEARLNKVVNSAQDAIIMLDPDGAISTWNDSAVRIFGYSVQEVMGRNFHQLIAPERYHKDHMNAFETFLKTGEGNAVGSVVELNALRKGGEEFPVELALSSVRLNNQWHAIGIIRDTSDRKAAEKALDRAGKELIEKHAELTTLFQLVAQAKREWEQTLDHLSDFVILTDADHRIRRCNKLLSETTGKPINELIGVDWVTLIDKAGFRFVTFNGMCGELYNQSSGRSYDITTYPINDNGDVTGHVISLNDTTDLRSTTKELEKAYAELKEAQVQIFQQEKMASIGQLAAGVAHEINNPMGFISSNLGTLIKYVDRLAEYISTGDKELISCCGNAVANRLSEVRQRLKIDFIIDDARQLIAESQDGASRVRRIVQNLKSFSRVDQVDQALIDLNETLETTINIAWNEIKYVASLTREFGNIPEIVCYPQQLNQVFLNLLVNAAHAMEGKQGSITVRTWSEADSVFVSVTDTGCGIPDGIQKRIFEPFFTTKEVGKGTGLGLSISYDIIQKHGGEITVESEVGFGSTFVVRLPVVHREQQ
jgi:two-component system NtrC family sensor kinase